MSNNTRKNWKKESRGEWESPPLEGSSYIGDEKIKIGCLQRIADALEQIAERLKMLDPVVHDKRRKSEEVRRRLSDWHDKYYYQYYDNALGLIDMKINKWFSDATCEKKNLVLRQIIESVERKIFVVTTPLDSEERWAQVLAENIKIAEDFNPAAFTWRLLEVKGKSTGKRFKQLLDSMDKLNDDKIQSPISSNSPAETGETEPAPSS